MSCAEARTCRGRDQALDRDAGQVATGELVRAGEPARADQLAERPLTRVGELPAVRPRWHVTLPGVPGLALIEHSAGPVLVPGPDAAHAAGQAEAETLALFASSALGFVAVDAATGAVRWTRPGEQAPGLPIAAASLRAGDATGDEVSDIWLPGRCLHQASDAPVPAMSDDAAVLGCVEIVDRAGVLRHRTWIQATQPELTAPMRGHRSRAIGALDSQGLLLWARGPDVLAVDVRAGSYPGQAAPSAHVVPGSRLYRAPEALETDVCGWLGTPESLVVATCDGLMAFDLAGAGDVRTPAWHLSVPRSVGVAGPVRAGPGLAWVRDHELQAGSHGRIAWTAAGSYAYAPGSLSVAPAHAHTTAASAERLLAVRMASSGIQPVLVDAASGQLAHEGQPAPGIQVLAAAPAHGGLVLAVRLDASLRRDAIIAWDASLRVAWAWPLPMPPRPRTEPIGLAVLPDPHQGGEILVFYDGRFAVRLPQPTAPGPDAPEPAHELDSGK